MRESTLMEKVMKRTVSFSSVYFFIFSSSSLFLAGKSAAKVPYDGDIDKVTALFIFGDSFLDAGNNNYINTTTLDQANFPPYGQTFFGLPTGRFSDGRLISDFIAEYAKLPLIPPFLEPGDSQKKLCGVNFASAGAGALVETFQGWRGHPLRRSWSKSRHCSYASWSSNFHAYHTHAMEQQTF